MESIRPPTGASTPEEWRKLMLRLLNLPPELVQRTLIDVPLPHLLEICTHVQGYAQYCQDRNFWLARAQARYGISPARFERAESIQRSEKKLPGVAAYLSLLTTYLSSKCMSIPLAQKRETAKRELTDIENVIKSKLRQVAQEKAHDAIVYYGIDQEDIDSNDIFPASSPEEALLAMHRYLKDKQYYYDIIRDRIVVEIDVLLDEMSEGITTSNEIRPLNELIDFITGSIVSTFEDGELIRIKTYQRILPREI